jgi:hypothetical protein
LVLDHDRHAEPIAEALGQDARNAVARAAGRKRDDEPDRPIRKRRVRAPDEDEDGAEHGGEQRPHGHAADARHFGSPRANRAVGRLFSASIVFQF